MYEEERTDRQFEYSNTWIPPVRKAFFLKSTTIKISDHSPDDEEDEEDEAMDVTESGLVTVAAGGGGGGGALGLGGSTELTASLVWPTRVSYILNRVGTKSSAVVVPGKNNKYTFKLN